MDADEPSNVTPIPPWKRNLAKAHASGNGNTPESRALAAATRAANKAVKECVLNALDRLGNEAFFIRLGNGNSAERCCFAMIVAKLIPLEVQGQLDHSLTVKIVKQVGEREVVIAGKEANLGEGRTPKDAVTGERMPFAPATIDHATLAPVDSDG